MLKAMILNAIIRWSNMVLAGYSFLVCIGSLFINYNPTQRGILLGIGLIIFAVAMAAFYIDNKRYNKKFKDELSQLEQVLKALEKEQTHDL